MFDSSVIKLIVGAPTFCRRSDSYFFIIGLMRDWALVERYLTKTIKSGALRLRAEKLNAIIHPLRTTYHT